MAFNYDPGIYDPYAQVRLGRNERPQPDYGLLTNGYVSSRGLKYARSVVDDDYQPRRHRCPHRDQWCGGYDLYTRCQHGRGARSRRWGDEGAYSPPTYSGSMEAQYRARQAELRRQEAELRRERRRANADDQPLVVSKEDVATAGVQLAVVGALLYLASQA